MCLCNASDGNKGSLDKESRAAKDVASRGSILQTKNERRGHPEEDRSACAGWSGLRFVLYRVGGKKESRGLEAENQIHHQRRGHRAQCTVHRDKTHQAKCRHNTAQ